jgi:hypothetical protein
MVVLDFWFLRNDLMLGRDPAPEAWRHEADATLIWSELRVLGFHEAASYAPPRAPKAHERACDRFFGTHRLASSTHRALAWLVGQHVPFVRQLWSTGGLTVRPRRTAPDS